MQQHVEEKFQHEINENLRKNCILSIVDGAIFAFAMGMVPLGTVIIYFMSNFVVSKTLLGLLSTFHVLLMFSPQILASRKLEQLRLYKPYLMGFAFLQRLLWLFLGLDVLLFAKTNPTLFVILFYVLHTALGLVSAFSGISWINLIIKLVPNSHRIKFFSIRSTIGGIFEAGGALATGMIVNSMPYPYNYGTLFISVSLITFVSYAFLNCQREPESIKEITHMNWGQYIAKLVTVLKTDRNFVNYLVTVALIGGLGKMAFAFNVVFAKEKLGINIRHVSYATFILLVSQTVGYYIWGKVGTKHGLKRTLELSAIIFLPSILLTYLMSNLPVFYLSIALFGIAQSARNINENNLAVNLAGKEENQPAYIGLRNLLMGPFFAFNSAIAGVLLDVAGYGVMFALSAMCMLAGFYILFRKVKEPRETDVY